MSHAYTNLMTHVIFSTKERRPYLDAELKPRLLAYMGGIIREFNGVAVTINSVTDHVHLLLSLPPTISVADALRILKTNSSRWVHETWRARREFSWQAGYGAFSASQSNVVGVTKYIADQEKHHRKVSFQDEFIQFLKKHRIEYDGRYIWQ
jgi:REP element-mobilizing transposase RayT